MPKQGVYYSRNEEDMWISQINIAFIISGGDCMYTINPEMSFGQVVASYQKYVRETQKRGKEPVTFLHFLTGRC